MLQLKEHTTSVRLKSFSIGFSLFTIGFVLISTLIIPVPLCRLIQTIGIIYIIPSLNYKLNFNKINSYATISFIIYTIWQFIIILNGKIDSFNTFQQLLFHPSGFFLYLSPLLIHRFTNIRNIKFVLQGINILNIIYIILSLLMIGQILKESNGENINLFETLTKYLAWGVIFSILMLDYLDEKQKKVAYTTYFIIIIIAMILGRRGLLLSNILVASFYIIFKYNSLIGLKKKILYLIMYLLALSILYFLIFTYGPLLFGNLFDRMYDDTRSIVDINFLLDLYPGSSDFIYGRGINGTYYCPNVDEYEIYRNGIESGYLNLILKGGFISVILFMLITIPAIFLGLFKSNNRFCKICAMFCLISCIDLYYISSVVSFSIRYSLFIMCILFCYIEKVRVLSDSEINKKLI